MTKKSGSDNIRYLAYASIFSIAQRKQSIDGDEMFLGIFMYTKEKKFFELFWKFLGLHETTHIQKYITEFYDIANELQPSITIKNLSLSSNLHMKLAELEQYNDAKNNFLVLLYIAIDQLSTQLAHYLQQHDTDVITIKNKLQMLMHNPVVQQIGIVAFFGMIGKLISQLNLSLNDISMFQFETKESIDTILNAMDHDFPEGGEDLWVESTINSSTVTMGKDKKGDEKKLTIEFFGTDLTMEAKDKYLDPVIGRDKEIQQIIYTLLRKTKNNPLLLGEPGVGKTAVVEGLAQRIVLGEVPEKLKNKRIMMLDMGTLLAGTKYRGEFESRLKAILEEAADVTNNIILFIDEIHTIIGSGNQEGSADAANMLKPLLARGKIKLIGATTFDEYQKHIEKDAALKRRFQELHIDEPNTHDTMLILQGIKKNFEDYHGVVIDDKAIAQAVELSKRYILNKHLPDKAIDIIDEASARKSTMNEKLEKNNDYKKQEEKLLGVQEKIEKAIEKQDYFQAAELKEQEEKIKAHMKTLRMKNTLPEHLRPTVSVFDVWQVLADKIGVPAHMVTESETDKLKRLEWRLEGSVVGQKDAIEAVVKSIKRNRLSVVQKNKPIASFLFLWPSGVGKTYLAKLLAKEYFGDEKALIRVDMSEFMEKHSASKLIGSPAGYVGYDEGGVLTEAVRRKPYSIVLFDEMEKASPDVLNILLQILDEGHLKDNKGRWIDFKSTIIILTSNIGSEEFGKKIASIGFEGGDEKHIANKDFDQQKQRIMERLKDHMKPELLNRLDYTIVFRPLSKEALGEIFVMKVTEFLAAWKEKEGVKIPKFTKKKVEEIIDKIYNPQFGARPIERYIYDEIEPQLIDQMMNA